MWSNDKAKYLQMRLDIFNASKRLCKENVLPLYLAMIEEFIKKNDQAVIIKIFQLYS